MSVLIAGSAATAAAACFAVATVAQHRSASDVPDVGGLQPQQLLAFARATLRHRLWLLGLGADVAGLSLHVLALAQGSLALVQPLLTSGLLFALLARRVLDRQLATRPELVPAAILVAGLSIFLVAAAPAGGSTADRLPAVLLAAGLAILAGTLLVLGRRYRGRLQAAFYGTAAGISLGATAALIKTCTNAVSHGWLHLLASPGLWVLLVVGPLAVAINQLAFQAGPLSASMPVLSVCNPLVSLAAGLLVFDEQLSGQPIRVLAATAGLLVVLGATFALSRQDSQEPLQVGVTT